MLKLFLNLTITVGLETIVALCFDFKRNDRRIIALINLITNASLTVILSVIAFFTDNILITIPITIGLEIIIVVVEAFLFKWLLEKEGNKFAFSIVANLVSFIIGTILVNMIIFFLFVYLAILT